MMSNAGEHLQGFVHDSATRKLIFVLKVYGIRFAETHASISHEVNAWNGDFCFGPFHLVP